MTYLEVRCRPVADTQPGSLGRLAAATWAMLEGELKGQLEQTVLADARRPAVPQPDSVGASFDSFDGLLTPQAR